MYAFFELFFSYINAIIGTMFSWSFDFNGYTVSVGGIMIAFVIVYLLLSVFWKGATK